MPPVEEERAGGFWACHPGLERGRTPTRRFGAGAAWRASFPADLPMLTASPPSRGASGLRAKEGPPRDFPSKALVTQSTPFQVSSRPPSGQTPRSTHGSLITMLNRSRVSVVLWVDLTERGLVWLCPDR